MALKPRNLAGLVGGALVLVGVAVGIYEISKQQQQPSPITPSHGHLLVTTSLTTAGSDVTVNATPNDLLGLIMTGMTPGALIRIYFGLTPDPSSGLSIAATTSAEANGNASWVYQLTGTPPPVFYVLAYDTSFQSLSGYSNPVQVIIQAPPPPPSGP